MRLVTIQDFENEYRPHQLGESSLCNLVLHTYISKDYVYVMGNLEKYGGLIYSRKHM